MSISVDSLEPELQALVGTDVNGIQIDGPIGIGGMGVVFRGHQAELSRDVAVKVANPSLGPENASRFLREAKAAAVLDHPNCITVFEFGAHLDMQYMVMPLLSGRPLNQVLSEPISMERALDMGLQIFRGLEHAHSRNLVHRDLKPENVFVVEQQDGSELLKIVDFGIAKIVEPDALQGTATMSGLMSGTPEYMSPEQALGLPTDPRSDIYSAGIILYRLLAGALPFSDDDPIVQLRRHITDEVPALPSTTPRPVARMVARMVRKERDERYQTATEALADLRAIMGGAHVLASDVLPEPPAYASLDRGVREERIAEDPASASSQDLSQRAVAAAALDPMASGDLEEPPRGRGSRALVYFAGAGLAVGVALTIGYAAGGSGVDRGDDPPNAAAPEGRKEGTKGAGGGDEMLAKLGLVNETDPSKQLDYRARHRSLEELALDPKTSELIDEQLNLALDLLQAAHSPTPCTTFRSALEAIVAQASPFFDDPLQRAIVPKPGVVPGAGEPPDGSCEGLGELHSAALGALRGARGDDGDLTPGASPIVAEETSPPEPAREPRSRRGTAKREKKRRPAAKPSNGSAATPATASAKAAKPTVDSKKADAAPWERRTGGDEVKNPFD